MKESEIIFAVEESPEGGYEARAVGHPIFTQADSTDELRQMVRDAVRCHFDTEEAPSEIRLHFTRSDNTVDEEIATIGKSFVIKGHLSGSEDLIVDGEVEGSIAIPGGTLIIGHNGRVDANIKARNVILHGRVNGDIHAAHVELRKSASLRGNILTARISIEDGAYFKGAIDIERSESIRQLEERLQTADEVIAV